MLERAGERAMLAEAVERARSGSGSLVVVEGDAGVGKTSLLGELAALGEAAGMRVLRAAGGELEREYAYGAVRQLLGDDRGGDGGAGDGRNGAGAPPLDPFAVLNRLYWRT